MAETSTQRLATLLLGEELEDYVRSRRAERRAWRLIARDIYLATKGEIDVTHETLRTWYPDEAPARSAS